MVKEYGVLKEFDMGAYKGVINIPSLGADFPFSWDVVRLLDEKGDPVIKPSYPRRPPIEKEMVVYLEGHKKELVVEFVVYKKNHDEVREAFGLTAENSANREDDDFPLRPAIAVA